MFKHTHVQEAYAYALACVTGEGKPVNKWVKMAAKRFLNMYEAQKDDACEYYFDEDKAIAKILVIQTLHHVEGKWAVLPDPKIKLEPWQKFILVNVFGFISKDDNKRLFRKVYACIPRKNAKSTLAAGIGLSMLGFDGEPGAQVYCGATSEKQANFVFKPAMKMAEKCLGKYKVEVSATSIFQETSNSRFERLIGNPGDGGSPSCALIDEYHEHDDDALYDTMVTGTGAREQPLIFVITTAGFNTGGPCFLMHRNMERMLEGTIDLPNTFAIMYGIDEKEYDFEWDGKQYHYDADDWTTLAALEKANPNWGISVNAKNIRADHLEAINAPEKQNTFKTKHLNVWCSARAGFFNVEAWRRLGDSKLDMYSERFLGKRAMKGLDLASQIDIAADVTIFEEKDEKGLSHYYIFPKFYVPERTVHEPKNQHYLGWFNKDMLIGTEGDETDYLLIKNNILKDAEQFQMKELCFDKYQATFMKQTIMNETSLTGIEVPQRAEFFSPAMEMLRAMITSGRVHHNGNEVLDWMVANVVSKEDGNEQHFPRKEKSEFKIDGVTALLNVLTRVVAVFGDPETKYRKWTGF